MANVKAKKGKKKAKGNKTKSKGKLDGKALKKHNKKVAAATEEKETKLKKKLTEHTAFKNLNKKKKKGRTPVWVKKFTLEYEEELNKLQIEMLKWQKHVIANEERVLLLFEGRDAAARGGHRAGSPDPA